MKYCNFPKFDRFRFRERVIFSRSLTEISRSDLLEKWFYGEKNKENVRGCAKDTLDR